MLALAIRHAEMRGTCRKQVGDLQVVVCLKGARQVQEMAAQLSKEVANLVRLRHVFPRVSRVKCFVGQLVHPRQQAYQGRRWGFGINEASQTSTQWPCARRSTRKRSLTPRPQLRTLSRQSIIQSLPACLSAPSPRYEAPCGSHFERSPRCL